MVLGRYGAARYCIEKKLKPIKECFTKHLTMDFYGIQFARMCVKAIVSMHKKTNMPKPNWFMLVDYDCQTDSYKSMYSDIDEFKEINPGFHFEVNRDPDFIPCVCYVRNAQVIDKAVSTKTYAFAFGKKGFRAYGVYF